MRLEVQILSVSHLTHFKALHHPFHVRCMTINDINIKANYPSDCRKHKLLFNFDWHLAREELFPSVAVDMGAEEDAPCEGFATVGANMG